MKRTIGAMLLTLGLLAGPLGRAHAAPGDQVRGKPCYDIQADINYADRPAPTDPAPLFPPTVGGFVETPKAPACPDAYITLTVFDTAGNVLGTPDVKRGDGVATQWAVAVEVPTGYSSVCVLLTSETSNHKVVDSAPDQHDVGCVNGGLFLLNGATGGRPMG